MENTEVELPLQGCSSLGVRKSRTRMWLALLGIFFCVLTSRHCQAQTTAKNVLILYSYNIPSVYGSPETLESSLRSRVPMPVNFFVEYLEAYRAGDQEYEETTVETLQRSYGQKKLDLVMVGAYPALQFALKYRDQMFSGAPIVFFTIGSQRLAGQKMWPGVTGTAMLANFSKTVELALKFHPNAHTLVIINTNTVTDRYWLNLFQPGFARDHSDVKEIDLVGLSNRQLLERLAPIPPNTIVFYGIAPRKSVDPALGAWDVLSQIAQRWPTYCADSKECLAYGGVGAVFPNLDEQISLGAQIGARVLSGERPENIPVVNIGAGRFYANWRELRRWHISTSALPPNSVILYRPTTLWERDRKYLIIALTVIGAQMLLIVGLLWQRARKRKAEAVLRESEERFRVMADTTPSLIWMCDAHGKFTYLNERRIAFTGPDPEARYGETWIAHVHPDDVKNMLNTLYKALQTQQSFSQEYRLRRSDGIYRWILDVASPRVNGDGSFAGFIGSAIDTTDQKLAQKALEKVSGQLIEAQEKERSRIARDLHDDICQKLAMLSMKLAQANRNSTESPSTVNDDLKEIRKNCSEISMHVHLLSHQLHSSKLDYLGVVAAIRGMCNESSEQHQIRIVFSDKDVPKQLPKNISLCLFRVAQEAVHNAVKYSGTREFSVEILGIENEIQLVVQDAGAGFDVEETKKNPGLGMISMQERMNLVHGSLSVESTPGEGTRIIAIVPLNVESGEIETASFTRVA